MFHASRVGLRTLLRRMREFAANEHADPAFWKPAPLITRLAAAGLTFDDAAPEPRRARARPAAKSRVIRVRKAKGKRRG